ncbi:hypothetical protein CHUAL_009733 [Chamberlinius hualienensis]
MIQGFDSLVDCASLDAGEESGRLNKIASDVKSQFLVSSYALKSQLIVNQWLTINKLRKSLASKFESLEAIVSCATSDCEVDISDRDVLKWRSAVDDIIKNDVEALKRNLWKNFVESHKKTEWTFGGMLVFTTFVVVVVSAVVTMSQIQQINADNTTNRLLKRSLFEYLTGKYLVPQNCKIYFNWEEPCQVGGVMSLSVKFYQRNGRPYPICNKDNILVEVSHNNLKVASSVEVGSPDPSLANTVLVKFTVRRAGQYLISAMIGNTHIKGSPFIKHFIPGPPDPMKTSLVNHVSTIVCSEGVNETLVIECRDEYNNHCIFGENEDPSEDFKVLIEKLRNGRMTSTSSCNVNYDYRLQRTILCLKFDEEGCYKAEVKYKSNPVRNGEFNIIVLSKEDAIMVTKNVSRKNHNVYYEGKLMSVNGESLLKPKKIYLNLSPKQLTIKEMIFKFIPKRLYTFRLCPSTKFQFQYGCSNDNTDQPQLIIDDGCQPVVQLTSSDANVIVASFTKHLLKNIGGSETFKDKRDFFYHEVRKFHSKRYHEKLVVRVQRDDLLSSSMKASKGFTIVDWCKNFEITFIGEQGLDWGGPSREWMTLLCNALFETTNQLFIRFKDDKQGLVHPNPHRPSNLKLKYYEFAGKLVGKCLYESSLGGSYRQLVKARFTRSFLAQLIGLRVHYKYFEQDDPDLYVTKIKYIIENDVDEVDLRFSEDVYEEGKLVEVVDLIPGGAKTAVTNHNKLQYLDALAQHRLANPVKDEVEAFLRGLNELIPDNLLSMFDEYELELLMCGTGQYSVADFRANHSVSGSSYEFRKVLNWFWTAVSNFTEAEMARLLQFITGCSQLPANGFSELSPRIQIVAAPTYGTLPTAHTCFNQLCLPDYESYEKFEKALLLAINEGSEGFGLI